MLKLPRRATLFVLAISFTWAGPIAVLSKPYLDPLTGLGLPQFIGLIGLKAVLAGTVTALFFRRWYLLGSVLAVTTLFFALPAPSKPGVNVQITNTTTETARVTLSRAGDNARKVVLSVPPRQTLVYRTAPGDFSEILPLTVEYGNFRLPLTVGDLRNHSVQVMNQGVFLKD